MGSFKIDLKFASKVIQGYQRDCNILTIEGPSMLIYIIILTFKSIWILI